MPASGARLFHSGALGARLFHSGASVRSGALVRPMPRIRLTGARLLHPPRLLQGTRLLHRGRRGCAGRGLHAPLVLMVIDRDQDFHSLSASLSTYAQPLGRAEDGIAVPTGTAKNLDMTTGGSIRWVGVLKPPPLPHRREAPSLSAVSPMPQQGTKTLKPLSVPKH